MKTPRFQCLFAAAFFTFSPYTPQTFLETAKREVSVSDKIAILRRLMENFPLDATAKTARSQVVSLLIGSNRFEEALLEYQKTNREPGSGDAIDFRLLDYMLKTGRYTDVLKATNAASGPVRNLSRDMKLLEVRVQALLARGRYQLARESVDQWLQTYEKDGEEGTRFEMDVRSIRYLRHHLRNLERGQGPFGKPIFTASVPHSLQAWSRRRDVPIHYFKLVPTHQSGQISEPVLPGRHESDGYFKERVDDLNRGLDYLSGGAFSLAFQGMDSLYVKEGDVDPISSGGHILTSRVYVHTIPQLYKLAGEGFVVLVDYRASADGEAAYMGDGIIHISASKLQTLVMMHELLHGLGATHNEWAELQKQGFQFDSEDRGLMTFEQGEIRNLGLEEKNRALLGWPRVSVVRFNNDPVAIVTPAQNPSIALHSQPTAGLN